MSFLGWLLCIEKFKGTVLTKSQNWATRPFILKKKKKEICSFREFAPKTQQCCAQKFKKGYSGWTDLFNSGIFFSGRLVGGAVLTKGK